MELALRVNVIVRGSIINTKTNISGSAGPIFAIFTPNESVLSVQ